MKIKKLLVIALSILALGAITILLFANNWAEKALNEQISSISGIKYDSLDINIADKEITLYNTSINIPTVSASIDRISADGLSIYQIIANDKISLSTLNLEGVSLEYKPGNENAIESKSKMPDFIIDRLELNKGNAIITTPKNNQAAFKFDIGISNIDKDDLKNSMLIANKIEFAEIRDLIYTTSNHYYNAGARLIQLEKNIIGLDSVYVKSNFEKYELGRHVGHEIDWYDFQSDSILISVKNMEQLINQHEAEAVVIHNPTFIAFRDKRLPFPEGKRGKLLKEILANSKYSFGIDLLEIKGGKATYQEYVKSGDGPGEVTFEQFNATFENLYTYDKQFDKQPRLKARTLLYGKSTLFADISFPLRKSQPTFVTGVLHAMDLRHFNHMLKYVAFTELEEGTLDSLTFNFSYTSNTSEGQMHFGYKDLKIDFLNKHDAKTGGFLNELKGFVANTFVVRRNNPETHGKFRVGEISAQRKVEKSMFNFWWQSILSGFRSSTGVQPAEEKINR